MKLPFHNKTSLMFLNSRNKITGTSLYILLHDTLRQHDVTKYSFILYSRLDCYRCSSLRKDGWMHGQSCLRKKWEMSWDGELTVIFSSFAFRSLTIKSAAMPIDLWCFHWSCISEDRTEVTTGINLNIVSFIVAINNHWCRLEIVASFSG